MKKALVAAAALILGTWTSAGAQTLPTPVDDWTGFYVGVHGGPGQANRQGCSRGFTTMPLPDCTGMTIFDTNFNYNQTGLLGGAQAGFNWQSASNLVLGVEVDGSFTNMKGTLSGFLTGGVGDWNWLATATAKLGWANGPFMIYGEGGYAIANADFAGNFGCNFNMTHTGPLAGAGIGLKLTENVSLDINYNHIWLDTRTTGCTTTFFVPIPSQVRTSASMDILKLALNFRLGG